MKTEICSVSIFCFDGVLIHECACICTSLISVSPKNTAGFWSCCKYSWVQNVTITILEREK